VQKNSYAIATDLVCFEKAMSRTLPYPRKFITIKDVVVFCEIVKKCPKFRKHTYVQAKVKKLYDLR